MKFDIFVGRQHHHFQEVDLISVDSIIKKTLLRTLRLPWDLWDENP
jgi:hypothetical protein